MWKAHLGWLLLAPAVIALAGCHTPQTRLAGDVPEWQSQEFLEARATSDPEPAPVAISNPPPALEAVTTNSSPQVRTEHGISETWVPLIRWSKNAGLEPPVLLRMTPGPAYALKANIGTFVIRVGSQVASWDGVEIRLGFSPQWIDRQPYVHRLDLTKTLEPLLLGGSLRCSNPQPVLVIDPGHGGTDSGARSALGDGWEKQFTLDWARRLQALLATNGWRVLLTRDDDQELALSNRVVFAEHHKADLFLSLHFNSAGSDGSQAGLETYCLTPRGMPSGLTRGYADDPAISFPNNAFDVQNMQLAFRVHQTLLQVNGHADRGVRRARFLGVLRGQQRPAILVEGGYLSNPREARRIADPAYRQKLAEAIARALSSEKAPAT